MKYRGSPSFSHSQADKIGVLITNLGSPDAPTKKSLRVYLKEFLSDPRVVEVPRLIWWFILNLVILNIRPRRSAHAYSTVWTDKGSPLLVHTKAQAEALANRLHKAHGESVVVDYAMRYGNPALPAVMDKMFQQGVRKLVVLPLYPQYCASTTGSTFDALSEELRQRRWIPDLRFVSCYHDHTAYIDALATKIQAYWDEHGRAQKLLLSYHGIPQRYLENGDPYFCHCHKTTRLVAEKLGLSEGEYLTTFQSRFGREQWLTPYTDESLKSLAAQGVESVQVVCPGFSSDCLETIEEIGEENRDYFLEAGGKSFAYIEALNSDENHIEMMAKLVEQNMHGWEVNANLSVRNKEASELGAKS